MGRPTSDRLSPLKLSGADSGGGALSWSWEVQPTEGIEGYNEDCSSEALEAELVAVSLQCSVIDKPAGGGK